MDHWFEVTDANNFRFVTGKADSEDHARQAAFALARAFPDAHTRYQRKDTRGGAKSLRWQEVAVQSPADFGSYGPSATES